MIEVVAKAICRGLLGDDVNPDALWDAGPAELRGKPMWWYYRPAARLAIAAMRQPTKEMVARGEEHIFEHRGISEGWMLDRAEVGYSAMIDAALAETP